VKFKINQKNIGGLDPRYFKLYTLSEILPYFIYKNILTSPKIILDSLLFSIQNKCITLEIHYLSYRTRSNFFQLAAK